MPICISFNLIKSEVAISYTGPINILTCKIRYGIIWRLLVKFGAENNYFRYELVGSTA